MPVTPQSLRNAADFMQKASGVDPAWLREAADEIEQLRRDLSHAKAMQEVWMNRTRKLESAVSSKER